MKDMGRNPLVIISLFGAILFCGVLWAALKISTPQKLTVADTSLQESVAAKIKREQLACIEDIPLEIKIGQKLMAAGYASQLYDETAAFAATSIGGVIMMDETSAEEIAHFRQASAIAPFIAVDQEGGTVQRFSSTGDLAGAEQMAASGSTDLAYERYLTDNTRLKEYGITTNFAPVVDVSSRAPNPLPGRMYSHDPAVVTDYAKASITAAQKAGITPVIKHFPGLGSATGNTDFTVATTDPLSVLESRDFIPYKKLASLHPDVMVGNMIVPGLTDGQPAIWSNKAVTMLRGMGYQDAVIYTDSLTAEAIPGDIKDAALKAWRAGIDVALIVQPDTETANLPAYFDDIIRYAVAAVQSDTLSTSGINESVLRIFERKQVDPCQLQDLSQLH